MAAPPHEDLLGALTPRETQVLRRIVAGQSTGQMAREMDVATSTLRSYIKTILAKLGAHSRLQAAAIASRESGLVNETQRPSGRNDHEGSASWESMSSLSIRNAPSSTHSRPGSKPMATSRSWAQFR